MADIGKQLKNVMSSIRVADRITSLIRNDERSKASARTDIYRVAVALAPPSVSSSGEANPIGRDFKFSLVDKKTSEHVHVVIRAWPIFKQVVLFIRGVVPKLDVPPLPVETAGSAPALIAEDRRKFIQTYVNAALQHTIVANLKEFMDLIGLTEYQALHAHDAPTLVATSNGSFAGSLAADRSKNTSSTEMDNNSIVLSSSSAKQSTLNSSPRQQKPDQRPSSAGSSSVVDAAHHTRLEECFRVMDIGGAGYLTSEDMKSFLDTMSEVTPRSKAIVQRIMKDGNALAATDFASMVVKAADGCASSAVGAAAAIVDRWIVEYRNTVFSDVYAALGQQQPRASDGEGDAQREYDSIELRTLQFVLRVSGVRIITEAEIDREENLSLPVTGDDFCRLMSLLVDICPFDDVIRALEKTPRGDHTKFLHLVCKHAAASATSAAGSGQKRQALRSLQEAIAECGGGPRRLGKCGNCEASEQRIRAMKLKMTELEDENASLKQTTAELEDQLAIKDHEFADAAAQATTILALEQETASLRERLAEWESRAVVLEERVRDFELLEEGNATEDRPPAVVYEVRPTQLGSTGTSLIDLPGPITIPIGGSTSPSNGLSAAPLRPSGLAFDVFYTGRGGSEYIACRDQAGVRSVGLRIEDGVLSVTSRFRRPGPSQLTAAPALSLPQERWIRCTLLFDWLKKVFSMRINGIEVWQCHMMEERVDGVAVLDIYPRHEVLYCFANIRFLVD